MLEMHIANTGSIAFRSITFASCQCDVLKIDTGSPGVPYEFEGRIQLRNYCHLAKRAAVDTACQVVSPEQ